LATSRRLPARPFPLSRVFFTRDTYCPYQIFANIFGYATHKHRILPSSGSIPPSSFVPSIFSSPYQGTPTSRTDSSSRVRANRSQSRPIPDDHRRHGRQASELDVSSSSSQRERVNTRSGIPFRTPFHAPGTRLGPSGSTEPESPRVPHRSSSASWLPTAVVVTGLEHSSVPCHRALLRALLENRVTFDEDPGGAKHASWDLPEDFVLVYVCPFDPRERPSVHKSLACHLTTNLSLLMRLNQKHATCSSTNFRSACLSPCISAPDKRMLRTSPRSLPARGLRPKHRRPHSNQPPLSSRVICSRVFAPSARRLT